MWIEFPCNSTPNHRMERTDTEQTDAFRCNLWTGKSVLVSQGCHKKVPRSVVVQLLSGADSLWSHGPQASLSFTASQTLLKFMSTELVMPSNHLIICCPLSFLSSIFPSIRVFSSEAALHIKWPKYWSFNFSINLGGLKLQKCILSQYWRLAVWNQGVSAVGFFWWCWENLFRVSLLASGGCQPH